MSSKFMEADILIFPYAPHTSFIKIRRHGFVIKYLSVYILLCIHTTRAYILKCINWKLDISNIISITAPSFRKQSWPWLV